MKLLLLIAALFIAFMMTTNYWESLDKVSYESPRTENLRVTLDRSID